MKYTFTRKQIVNAFNNKILDDDNFLTYLLSTTIKDIPMNQKSLDKKKTKKLIMDKGRGSCSSAKSLGNHSAIVHPKELEWEKEFNDKWGGNVADYQRFFHIDDEPDNDRENIKDFIKFLLTQQKTELLEEILNLECLKEEKITKNIFSITQLESRNQLRNEIKEQIKKL